MTIPALPAAPAPTDTPAEFNSKAFAFLAALDPWGDAADALAVEVNADAAAAAQSALDATSNGAAQVVLATAQAEIASTQAGIATTKAGEALSSANAAAASETAAGLSATSAAASFDSFDDRYLGAKTSNPSLDNDGNALLTGALYFNSSVGEMRVYNGSAWAAAYIPAEGYLTDSDIGTTVQAYDSDLTNWAGIATSAKQDTLVSGTNIKTVNSTSLLGSGDVAVQPTLVSGTNIKTVNGESVLGSGDIAIAGGLTYDFTLSQSITEGQIVQLLANGEIEKISATSTTTTEIIPNGNLSQPFTNALSIAVDFDPSDQNRFVVAWRDNGSGDYGAVALGTISGTTISWSPKFIFASYEVSIDDTNPLSMAIAFDPAQAGTFLISYRAQGQGGVAQVIAGQIIAPSPYFSFGSAVSKSGTYLVSTDIAFDSANNSKAVVVFKEDAVGRAQAYVVALNGTAISAGPLFEMNPSQSVNRGVFIAADGNTPGRFAVIASSGGALRWGTATISGTDSLVFSNLTSYTSNGTANIAFDYKSGLFIAVSYSSTFYVHALNPSNLSVLFSTQFSGGPDSSYALATDPYGSGKFILVYRSYNPDNNISVNVCELLTSSFSIGPTIGMSSISNGRAPDASFDPNGEGRFVTVNTNNTSSNRLAARLGQISTTIVTTNLDASKIVGAIEASGTTGDVRSVALKGGLTDKQTGLTVGSTYYVLRDGSLATAAPANQPYAKLGRAISPTAILLVGDQ